MRVVQIGPLPPPHGGVSTNLKAIHDLLISRGHSACVIAITESSRIDNIPNGYKPRSAFQLIRLLLTLDFDVVHFHIGGDFGFRLAVLTLVCGLLPGKKSAISFHSGGYALAALKFAKPLSLRGIAFRSVDFLIGVNSQMLDMFRAYGVPENKMRLVLPFALSRPDPKINASADLNRFISAHEPFLLSVGGLEPEYSHSLMIAAIDGVLRKLPNAGLIIVGSGSLEPELRQQIAEKEYADKILLVNDVEHAIVLHLIEKADVLLRLTKYDGDAISVREALFLQTPVIATDNGMRPDGVKLISSSPTLDEVAESIAEIIGQAPAVQTGNSGDGLKNIEAVLSVYEDLMSK